ncbi:trypsin serine proteinase T26 [Danaus plexippus plexippus]|uniref:Trypsin serine proteinase T26 n=1 Tax=Danaus plexippus plexippus TaxID=278856 RepID=A0A212FMW9_DANPL|nr:trypsin serine proteinase T26 [Danaus plexippus plexippus]
MAALGALLVLFAVSWVGAYPSPQLADFPENARGGNTRIVSGWEAVNGQIPYQLSLRMVDASGSVFGCGATLIHNEWAMTAAHCTARRVTIVIRVGGVELSRPSLILESTEYYNHPLYIESLAGVVQPNDIGLIKLNKYVQYNDLIQPIRIQRDADKNKDYSEVRLQASGWGRTWTNGASPQILNWVYLLGVSNNFCRSLFTNIVVDSTICANAYNVSSQSTCQGDSGGPLVVVDEDGQLTQVGVSSFVSSSGCHTPLPAGFIRPGHYHSWFSEITGIDFDWDFVQPTVPEPSTTEEVTTSVTEDLTTEPAEDVTTGAPEDLTTEPAEDVTTGAPEDLTTEPSEEVTTGAPEDLTTEGAEEITTEASTAAPEEEEEQEEDKDEDEDDEDEDEDEEDESGSEEDSEDDEDDEDDDEEDEEDDEDDEDDEEDEE